jgi:hypothetical protein
VAFRLWHGLATTEAEFAAKKPLWRVVSRDTLKEVLWIAMKVNDDGRETAWEIEGDDGFHLNRRQIAAEVRLRRNELIANPPKKY